jgi:hypothetical protein
MTWERYTTMRGRIFNEGDLVRVSNHFLKFSRELWKKEWNNCSHIILYFNKEENKIGFIPSMARERGSLKVLLLRNGIVSLGWSSFVRRFNLHFDKPADHKIQRDGELWAISLSNNGRSRI